MTLLGHSADLSPSPLRRPEETIPISAHGAVIAETDEAFLLEFICSNNGPENNYEPQIHMHF